MKRLYHYGAQVLKCDVRLLAGNRTPDRESIVKGYTPESVPGKSVQGRPEALLLCP